MSRVSAVPRYFRAGVLGVFMLLFSLVAAPALRAQLASEGAPAGEVTASDGFAEALLPEVGWRQAVLGRPLPAGTVITTWLDGTVEFDLAGAQLQLDPLSHLTVKQPGPETARVSLQTGVVTVMTEDSAVELGVGEDTVHISEGRARVSRESVVLEYGAAEVRRPGEAPVPLEAGAEELLRREAFRRIFSDP